MSLKNRLNKIEGKALFNRGHFIIHTYADDDDDYIEREKKKLEQQHGDISQAKLIILHYGYRDRPNRLLSNGS